MKKSEFLEQAGGYAQDLRNYLMSHLNDRETADDLAQDCILQAAELYDRNQYDADKSLKNWLFCMAYSRLVDYIRRQETHRRHLRLYPDQIRTALGWERPEAEAQPLHPSKPSRPVSCRPPASPFKTAYVRHLLQTGFAGLPVSSAQRRLLQLRYVEHLTYKQIAMRLKEPLSTVMSRHASSIRLLRGDYTAACHRLRKRHDEGDGGASC